MSAAGRTSLPAELVEAVGARLAQGDLAFAARYPGEASPSFARQPVHTVYGGAQLFRFDLARKLGDLALASMDAYAPDDASFADALGLPVPLAETVRARVLEKLRREPVEDLRVDFEDGYGARPDAEEDGHAEAAAREMARGLREGALPPFVGIRIKPLNAEMRARAVRTLDLFLTTLVGETGGRLPDGFVVTLPKVTHALEVAALADLLDALEAALGLAAGAIRLELMIETPQSILAPTGEIALHGLYAAARGRCAAAHFGAYDYTASLGVSAADQTLTHPACDFARQWMALAYAGTGVRISDGATNVLPIAPHRAAKGAPPLGALALEENRRAVHGAWRLHQQHIQRALEQGFYQGWDLHPAQLPVRYAAVHAFFLGNLKPAAERLRNFVAKAAQATLVGTAFDDAATGQGLLNFFLRALAVGALTEDEVAAHTTLSTEELRGRSFLRIAASRGRAA